MAQNDDRSRLAPWSIVLGKQVAEQRLYPKYGEQRRRDRLTGQTFRRDTVSCNVLLIRNGSAHGFEVMILFFPRDVLGYRCRCSKLWIDEPKRLNHNQLLRIGKRKIAQQDRRSDVD